MQHHPSGTIVRPASGPLESLLIIGTARSGTSFAAACAHYSGFPSSMKDSPDHNFEDVDLGTAIAQTGGLESEAIKELIELRHRRGNTWSFKYPPVSESTIALRDLFPTPGLVLVTRDPGLATRHDVVRSQLEFGARLADTSSHLSRLAAACASAQDIPLLWIPFEVARNHVIDLIHLMRRFSLKPEPLEEEDDIADLVAVAHDKYLTHGNEQQ